MVKIDINMFKETKISDFKKTLLNDVFKRH